MKARVGDYKTSLAREDWWFGLGCESGGEPPALQGHFS
jgi:hypothetical protein